jgi:hypothetical protein
MDKRFENLNNSIMFNLSLSSKELFHSNLLGYLFSRDNTLFGKIVKIKNLTTKEVNREHNHIDIEIIGDDGRKYLIENKVKSIIDDNQLDDIQTKNTHYEKYYLFSLLGNNLETLEKKDTSWEEVGYEHIITVLKEHRFNDKTIESIKNDYCAFMFDMISLLREHYLKCDKYLLFKDNSEDNLLEQYKKVRLHDVFQKYGVSHFVNYFRKKYGDTGIKSIHGYIKNGIMTFSSKETGDGEYSIEIQIEDGQYRKTLVGAIESENELLRKFESLGWFDENWRSARKLPYKSYDHKDGKKRWYQVPEKINNISYDDLAEKIKTDFDDVSRALKGFKG